MFLTVNPVLYHFVFHAPHCYTVLHEDVFHAPNYVYCTILVPNIKIYASKEKYGLNINLQLIPHSSI